MSLSIFRDNTGRLLLRGAALGTMLGLAGCGYDTTVDTVSLNAEASKAAPPKIELLTRGFGRGPLRVTMPDGEVLNGRYVAPPGDSAGLGTLAGVRGGITMTTVSFSQSGPFFAQGSGPRGTTIACQGVRGGMAGSAICETNGGARYQILW